ncbi:replication restart helicase PriA [Vicingus serpentipes]|uniref:replication restart helicase PriA n=1 Tax=Vicingus serpentipes TaxID=1926625 RepID=UPI001678DB6B|nr:primosomal protein N' [Vicingus serpentipes]
MSTETKFVDVIIPLSIPYLYTYRVPRELTNEVIVGQRVVVQFGRGRKLYSALIKKIHNQPPKAYEAKYIDSILDDQPLVNQKQLKHWDWIADYYLSNLGEVYSAALPGALKLASETKIVLNADFAGDYLEDLTDKEYQVYEALSIRNVLSLSEIAELLFIKYTHKVVKGLIDKKVVIVEEELKRKFKPKVVQYVRLTENANNEKNLEKLFEELSKAPKQLELLMKFIQLSERYQEQPKEVNKIVLQKAVNATSSVITQLVKKNIFEVYDVVANRLDDYGNEIIGFNQLNEDQEKATVEIKNHFKEKDVVLLHGVTGSGKTEIYIKLIQEALAEGNQVLYLLPEIALTTQLIIRLQKVFGDVIGVYHSKFNENERVEVWNQVLNFEQTKSSKYQVVMGARSAMFLPFSNLGLVIVDEEHENTFKQYDPAPRYNARDSSIVLANIHKAKILMGSATPSIENYWNAQQGKFGLVELKKRHGGVQMPEILCADIKEATRKKKMKSHFSPLLMEQMEEAFKNKEQVILFQNRRGYAPFMICEECGHVPECNNCDVSLTYHKFSNQLRCHYCGQHKKMPNACGACGSTRVTLKGFGTEQIEEELAIYFPKIKVARMDADSTRSKNAYHQLITDFEEGNIDVLVGTQMVTKGLDFNNVTLVGILNADTMLNFPDFRAFERAYQMMSQVSGRAGRKVKRGKVIIQTYDPYHRIIRQVIEHDYLGMYNNELIERKQFNYPPFHRLIHFSLKHRDKDMLNAGASEFTYQLQQKFGSRVLGPEFPVISRIKNYYHKNVLLKIEREGSISSTRKIITEIKNNFESFSEYKSVKITIDVDPM